MKIYKNNNVYVVSKYFPFCSIYSSIKTKKSYIEVTNNNHKIILIINKGKSRTFYENI